jgi:hypothetical protein
MSWATLRWSTASGAPRAMHVPVASPEGRVTVVAGCNLGGADQMYHLGRQAVGWKTRI